MEKAKPNSLCILHFNDAYNIQERNEEPVGGVSRFLTALKSYSHLNPLILFSGDAFSPSSLSVPYKGEHMIKPLNSFGIHVACVGNHDFDFDDDKVTDLFSRTNFPWLMTNVKMIDTELPFPPCLEYKILNHNNFKIGLIGLAEYDWIATLASLTEDDLEYEDFINCGNRWAKYLKHTENCDFVIALTHMRNYNDIILAEKSTDIDIILGGHDHVYLCSKINDKFVIKSGTDFREFNIITIEFLANELITQILANNTAITNEKYNKDNICKNQFHMDITKIEVTSKWAQDPELQAHVQYYMDLYEKKLGSPIGYLATELETRFSKIRSQETNFANFLADLCRIQVQGDVGILNSGTIRSDCIIPKGIFKMKDLKNMLPMSDKLTKLEITGKQLHKALEAGVSKYPSLEGRFPCVSGIKFTFDPKKEPMHRVIPNSIIINNSPIEMDQKYTLVCKTFIAAGKDGYDVLADCKRLIDEDIAEEIEGVFVKFFDLAHDQEVQEEITKRKIKAEKLKKMNESIQEVGDNANISSKQGEISLLKRRTFRRQSSEWRRFNKKMQFLELIKDIVTIEEYKLIEIAPNLEGRITILS